MQEQRGYVMVVVLILLSMGVVVITSALALSSTVLRSRTIHAKDILHDYAAYSVVEYGLWKVKYDPGYAASLSPGVESDPINITVNGVPASTTVVSQATTGQLSGTSLAKDHQILPTKAVFPTTAPPGIQTTFTYTITLQRMEPDDALFQLLASVKDGLDLGFAYVPNSSQLDGVPFNDDDLSVLLQPVIIKEEPRMRTISPDTDAMVSQGSPTQNYGTNTSMDVQSKSSDNSRVFVQFDVSDIPAGSTVSKAELELCSTAVPGSVRSYDVHRVTASWSESTITWDTQPAVATSATASKLTPNDPKCMKWNVEADVEAWANGTATNYGWRISDDSEDSSTTYTTTFRSQEDTTDPKKQPVLKNVEWTPGYETIEWKFNPQLNFLYGEKRTLSFQATATPDDNTRYCNVAEVKPNDTNTGMTATITVGTPSYAGCPGGGASVTKTADPAVIYPGIPTVVTYVISVTNDDIGGFDKFDTIEDFLPIGFYYVVDSATLQWPAGSTDNPDYPYNICNFEPEFKNNEATYVSITIDSVTYLLVEPLPNSRLEMKWHQFNVPQGVTPCHDQPLPYGATYTQTFQAVAILSESGSYYNEVIVKVKDTDKFGGDRGMKDLDKLYSGPTGSTIVPDFDLQAQTSLTTLTSNAEITGTGIKVKSKHWKKHR